jgi:hypothetical protein
MFLLGNVSRSFLLTLSHMDTVCKCYRNVYRHQSCYFCIYMNKYDIGSQSYLQILWNFPADYFPRLWLSPLCQPHVGKAYLRDDSLPLSFHPGAFRWKSTKVPLLCNCPTLYKIRWFVRLRNNELYRIMYTLRIWNLLKFGGKIRQINHANSSGKLEQAKNPPNRLFSVPCRRQ